MDNISSSTDRTFEQTLARIREIVATLESGSLPLEDAIASYREGAVLINDARRVIADAELRVRELSSDDEIDA